MRDYKGIVSLQGCMIVSGRICSQDCAYEYVYVCVYVFAAHLFFL